jgi:hypothetical protein
MRRSSIGYLSLVVLLGVLALGGRPVSAQDATGMDYSGHPLVGTWHLDIDLGGEDTSCPSQVIFTGDGGYIDVDCEGFVLIGVWEPTGDLTANMTFTSVEAGGGYRVRAAIEVAEDGQSFTATFTFEILISATGEGSGEYGPGTATGTRQVAEAPGTPEGSIEDLFSTFEEGTPAATPAS